MNKNALVAEFIGTFALIFVGVGAIASNFITAGQSGLVGIALAHGLTIAVMVAATGAISGGHLNTAVTIGLFCAQKIDFMNTVGRYCRSRLTRSLYTSSCFACCQFRNTVAGRRHQSDDGISYGNCPDIFSYLCYLWKRR